ncbi:hypothetical protein ASPZODRAFT_68717 [Penicilliopsis zonata CBS 506.65]|uniref:glutathione transferase n=1 Tax=Penicilliopsis zonata CBS 506.65 TaxID=1073090 RepID=A0A1L9SFS0_9EURO|nr:hypothetical protein ASPZODRAFT_68717 [Penicilliopsis zonata CBS 506.65]OJJ45947.1 hypothetical protein ASPZODRAFT_68717 [Penicilliopsis zonata CBS 506.65]
MPIQLTSSASISNDVPDRPLVFTVEGRYQNWIKPLILLESLGIPHDVVVLDGPTTRTDWFTALHPQRYVPALLDGVDGQRTYVWDSSAMLEYLAERYDTAHAWSGRDMCEKNEIRNWLTFETASLGPTAKYWVWYEMRTGEAVNPAAQEKLFNDLRVQYGIINARLSEPGQHWLGAKDRPTIADIATYPFADVETTARIGMPMEQWPALVAWRDRMATLPGVVKPYAEKDSWRAMEIR